MPPKGITLVFGRELNEKQMKQLKELTVSYAVFQDNSTPIKINLKDKNRRWICALNSKKETVGFSQIEINKKNRVVKTLNSFIKQEYRRKGIRTSMFVRTIALARGLGRYSIKLDWLDSETSLLFHQKFAEKLKARIAAKGAKGKSFAAGIETRKLSKTDKEYILRYYGRGTKSFRQALKNFIETYPTEVVFRKRRKKSISNGWIQMKQHPRNKNSLPSGPKRFGKTFFTPKGFRKSKPK